MIIETTSSPKLKVLSLDPLSDQVPVEPWQRLGEAAVDPNPFFGPGFLLPFLKHMRGQSVRLVVVQNEETGDWLMAAPVGRRRLGLLLPVYTAWATDYAPLGTPLLRPDASPEVLVSFFQEAAGSEKLLAIPYLPLSSRIARELQSVSGLTSRVFIRAERAYHASGAAGEAQLEAAFSGKRRKEMRRLLRRLGDHGTTRFECRMGRDAVSGFEAFLALEAAGWKGRAGTALKNQPETAAFAREAIENLAANGNVRIEQLWSGEALVASLVLIQQQGQIFSWKIAFDEAFARYSPGAQVALHAFRENLALPGFQGADSLAIPGHSMIEPLWRGRLETGTLLLGDGASSNFRQNLCGLDMSASQTLRRYARSIRKRLKS